MARDMGETIKVITTKKVQALNKRNEIISKLYKNMPEEEVKKTIVLLNDLQKLSSRINLT
jgi:hypothetical protein